MENTINTDRYRKQAILKEFGTAGQEGLKKSSVLIAGCGALGSVMANYLARAGVGHIRIADRDFIEKDNLHRQMLFDEGDISKGLPKAVAAAEKLKGINSGIHIEPVVTDITSENIEGLMSGMDLILDGSDNFETRFLINDASWKNGVPWIYGGVVGTYGMSYTFIPGETPCFRCFIHEIPGPGTTPTCDTAGVLGTAVGIIASIQSTEALKLMTGNRGALLKKLVYADPWNGIWKFFDLREGIPGCPVCSRETYEFLGRERGSQTVSLCGRNSMQVTPPGKSREILPGLAARLEPLGGLAWNEYMLRFMVDSYEITVFPDGRAIIKGTSDPSVARTLYSKYIGS